MHMFSSIIQSLHCLVIDHVLFLSNPCRFYLLSSAKNGLYMKCRKTRQMTKKLLNCNSTCVDYILCVFMCNV